MVDDISKDRRFSTTLERGLRVLRAFKPVDNGLGNGEISERTGIPKSTVSRLTFTLHQLGYLNHANRQDKYRLAPAMLALGNVANNSIPFVRAADASLQQLANDTGTLVLMAVRGTKSLLIVNLWRPADRTSLWFEVGNEIPYVNSSSGRTFMASINTDKFNHFWDRSKDYLDIDYDALDAIRRQTYADLFRDGFFMAIQDDYYNPVIYATSIPFHTSELDEPVVLTCVADRDDFSETEMRKSVGPALNRTLRDIANKIGMINTALNSPKPSDGR